MPENMWTDSKDALDFLAREHRKVTDLFDQFDSAKSAGEEGERDIAERICNALTEHAEIEDAVFYPRVEEEVKWAEAMVKDAQEEHESIKELIEEIRDTATEDGEMLVTKMGILRAEVEKHVAEEENDMFPLIRKSDIDLRALGQELAEYKEDLQKPLF